MADLDHVITVRLLSVIDDRKWREQATATKLRTEGYHARYAPLFDRAARFWADLAYAVEAGRPLATEQWTAVAYLRGPIERDMLAQTKRSAVSA